MPLIWYREKIGRCTVYDEPFLYFHLYIFTCLQKIRAVGLVSVGLFTFGMTAPPLPNVDSIGWNCLET